MEHEEQLIRWIEIDTIRLQLLEHVRSLDLPDCWIAAGFVRDLVWAKLHNQEAPLTSDVDVIWFGPTRNSEEVDRDLEQRLAEFDQAIDWSVKNQARMHCRNGDAPYASAANAMLHWPETATAIGVRLTPDEQLEICAPYGLSDLFELRLRPTTDFIARKRDQFDQRLTSKRWLERFPRLQLIA